MKILLVLFVMASDLMTPAWAETQTVTLSIPGMNCAACPFTIKQALRRVDGVQAVDVNYERREAVVRYSDTETTVETLTHATEHVGYPSAPKP